MTQTMISTSQSGHRDTTDPPIATQANFSRISSMVTAQYHQEENLERGGVMAGSDIPAGCLVSLGEVDVVLGHDLLDEQQEGGEILGSCVKVYHKNGRLLTSCKRFSPSSSTTLSTSSSASAWFHALRSARDRHEQNLELSSREGKLVVHVIKTVAKGEELKVWYSEELARKVGVPILSPCNIQGHQKYVCLGCQAVYTHPNTLKAHMLIQCRTSTISSSSDHEPLVPFQHLLQLLSRSTSSVGSAPNTDTGSTPSGKPKESRSTTVSPASFFQGGCSSCGVQQETNAYTSAFTNPKVLVHPVKQETTVEDDLMTPDSSTDQTNALNLSIKLAESCRDKMEEVHAAYPWEAVAAQRVMNPSLSIPMEYATLRGCFPVSPHLHAFGIQILNRSQATMQQNHSIEASLKYSLCPNGDNSLMSSRIDDTQDQVSFPLFKPQLTPVTTPIRPLRQSLNPYGFALPPDKEPLDYLPQAYFANKSKKGHLCLCCGKLYSRKYGLKIHMRTHNGYKPLKCKICSRPFGDPSNLNKHVRLHAQGETPYRCDFCGKVLVRRRDLERHVRSRHPMGCVQGDDALDVCHSSPDSSPASVESSENLEVSKDATYDSVSVEG